MRVFLCAIVVFYFWLMNFDFEQIYNELFAFCQAENFSGYDPFDGLNSQFTFNYTPLKYFAPARLAWLQMVKRSPVNLRPGFKNRKRRKRKRHRAFRIGGTLAFPN